MSLTGALFTGVSGLDAQTQRMATISENIANVNTVGFKRVTTRFATLVTESGSNDVFAPGGVRSTPFNLISEQGQVSASSSELDLAITGRGFFAVKRDPADQAALFTRAGSFTPDSVGNLRNAAGLFLQGWPLDANGNIPASNADLTSVETVNVATVSGTAAATTTVAIGINLDADQVADGTYVAGDMSQNNADVVNGVVPPGGLAPQFFRNFTVFDALGSVHELTVGYVKTATNTWAVELYATDPADVDAVAHPNGLLESGSLIFNGDGTPDGAATAAALGLGALNAATGEITSTVPVTWTNGSNASNIVFDWGTDATNEGLTQFASPFNVAFVNQNGAAVGLLNGVTVDEEGIVTASFNNGENQQLFKLPIVTFADANSLDTRSGNAFAETQESGSFNLREAGTGGAGLVVPSALESANVDIAQEFTDMIVTQRSFAANTRVITTADEMLDELIRIIR